MLTSSKKTFWEISFACLCRVGVRGRVVDDVIDLDVRADLLVTFLAKASKEEASEVSHSRTWMFLLLLRASRAERSEDRERVPAMMMLWASADSWQQNSRPQASVRACDHIDRHDEW